MVGVSQPGFHVAASIINSHPALKAASPQAPTADYYMGDDVYHNGAFMLGANFGFYSGFVPRAGAPEPPAAQPIRPRYADGYDFFLKLQAAPDANAGVSAAPRPTGRRSSTTRRTTTSGRSDRSGNSWTA